MRNKQKLGPKEQTKRNRSTTTKGSRGRSTPKHGRGKKNALANKGRKKK